MTLRSTVAKIQQRLYAAYHFRRELYGEKFYGQRRKLAKLLELSYSPVRLQAEPPENGQFGYALLQDGEMVTRGVVAKSALSRVEDDPPRISALMVTRNRPKLAQRAIHCFQRQTYPNKELLIIDDDPDDTLYRSVIALNDPDIVPIRLPDIGRTLGALRNLAVERASGAYVCQWDDDDLSHPERLRVQMALLQLCHANVCLLQREQLWNPDFRQFAISKYRFWEGSFLCAKAVMPAYPDVRKGEDTDVILDLVQNQPVVLLDYPELYTYVFHGANTFEQAHFATHWRRATARYEHSAYDDRVRWLEEGLELDLSAWTTSAPIDEQPATPTVPPVIRRATYPPVVILTPVKDAVAHLPRYFENLETLTYPAEQLSLAFLESDSRDGTFEWLSTRHEQLAQRYRRVSLFKQDYGYWSDLPRWVESQQFERRCTLAKSRNTLLMRGLVDEAWVLWMDVDLLSYPLDVIERLLSAEKKIVVPHCTLEDGRTFDLNSWKFRAGAAAWDWSEHIVNGVIQAPDGYGKLYLGDLREHDCVEIDAVGGTMLLVNADLHREGLNFPTFPYKHHLETDNLSFLARDMGYSSWGMPNVTIVHFDG